MLILTIEVNEMRLKKYILLSCMKFNHFGGCYILTPFDKVNDALQEIALANQDGIQVSTVMAHWIYLKQNNCHIFILPPLSIF